MVNVGKYTIHGTGTLPETNSSAPTNQKIWKMILSFLRFCPFFKRHLLLVSGRVIQQQDIESSTTVPSLVLD